jgi:probable HAF family extracellular repeat protein
MRDLGSLRTDNLGYSDAEAVSADGAVVVGYTETQDGNTRAFRWDTTSAEMRDLGSLRTDNLGYSDAEAVSADGAVVVGQADTQDGDIGAFIWRTQMQDFGNLMLSFPVLANDTEIAISQQQGTVGRPMDTTCLAEEGYACLQAGGWLSNTGATNADNIDVRSSQSATLAYGRGIDEQTTIGGTLSINGGDLNNNGFDMGSATGISLWTKYSQTDLARMGWQAGAALGWTKGNVDISRGRTLDNVMIATGEADMSTTGVSATLGYGFQQQDWLLTPSATLAHFETSRGAYAETGGDFNATYDRIFISRTTLTLQMDAERKVSETGHLLLSAGFEHDFNVDRITLMGTSDLPGMGEVSTTSTMERHETRGFASLGYTHDFGNNRALTGSVSIGQSTFGDHPQGSAGMGLSMRF